MGYCDRIRLEDVSDASSFCDFAEQQLGIGKPQKAHVESLTKFYSKSYESKLAPHSLDWQSVASMERHIRTDHDDRGTILKIFKRMLDLALQEREVEE